MFRQFRERLAWNRRVLRRWSAFCINVPQIKIVPMLNMNPLHIAWTHAELQAVQGEVGLEQESLGALECIFF